MNFSGFHYVLLKFSYFLGSAVSIQLKNSFNQLQNIFLIKTCQQAKTFYQRCFHIWKDVNPFPGVNIYIHCRKCFSNSDEWTRPKHNLQVTYRRVYTSILILFLSFWVWNKCNCQLICLVDVFIINGILQSASVS